MKCDILLKKENPFLKAALNCFRPPVTKIFETIRRNFFSNIELIMLNRLAQKLGGKKA